MGTFRVGSAVWRFCILLSLLLLFTAAQDATATPKVSRKEFDHQLTELFYFDDSDVVIVLDGAAGIVSISKDEGTTWSKVEDLEGVVRLMMNPFDNKVAVALGVEGRHWITKDQGARWREFKTETMPALTGAPLSFHAQDSNKIILNTRDARGGKTMYTTDGFETTPKVLRDHTIGCLWAKEQDLFTTGDEKMDRDGTLCIAEGKYSAKADSWRLVISDDFYMDSEFEPAVQEDRPVAGIANMVAVKGYILAARGGGGSDEMALYVTKDTKNWHRAQFGQHQLKEEGYTIMESTNYSLQVDVVSGSRSTPPMGMLFTSDSEGQYFTRNEDYTNRNYMGHVDFEKISAIQGIVLTNIVVNWQAVEREGADKRLNSKISFDDGRTFHNLTADDGKSLHLHSVTEQRNAGRVFSSPAPGLVMGIGNTGDRLLDYSAGDLYVSDDAGLTWRRALAGPHKYEFGDQGSILLAIYEEGEIGKMIYSLNHGQKWTEFQFEKFDFPELVRPQMLTTIPDSTSLKFLLMATTGRVPETRHWIYTIDFSGLEKKICTEDDFEKWYARVDADGKPTCIMGHTQSFRRRKATADCVIDVEFKDPLPINDNSGCVCTEQDYECNFGFKRSEDSGKCVPIDRVEAPAGKCKDKEGTFLGPSQYRLIPGNTCKLDGGVDHTGQVEWSCSDSIKLPATGEITGEITLFPASSFREYYYLESAEWSQEETVVLLTDERQVYRSTNHGKTWSKILEDSEILQIYPNRQINNAVYFITRTETVHYSKDRGETIHKFTAPGRPNSQKIQVLRFHPHEEDWLIWTTCAESSDLNCQPVAYVTTKGGLEWTAMLKSVENCEFVWRKGRDSSEKLVYCTQYANEDTTGRKQLVGSDDWFNTKTVHFEDMLNFATMSEYIIVAAKDGEDSKFLKVDSSIDGKTFADAKFPSNLQVPHQTAYTVLDSSTHSIFLHVTVNGVFEQEYGSIIKSNSNGTSYVMSRTGVNRNAYGYVDFEKMTGLEGVAVANVVANMEETAQGSAKKLKTMITHNDGAEWGFITPPAKDADGKQYECIGKDLEDCSLHLHGYTERKDPRDSFSSASALGLMIGIGNVGTYLGSKRDGNTFVSRDGGVTWITAKNGVYMWEYGDQGSVIVIVQDTTPTNVVFYSRDEGQTWTEYQFSDATMQIDDITTVPSDTSRNFLLWGKELVAGGGRAATVNLDFSGLTSKQCELKEPGTAESDYELWTPKHPLQDTECLFGHVAQYARKKLTSDCFNGPRLPEFVNIKENCTCTRRDFECDYNYERQPDGTCALVPGFTPLDPKLTCAADSSRFEYYDPSGYRKIQLSTCHEGKELEYTGKSYPCPGHEAEYRERRGISGAGLFFAIVVPVAVAVGVGYWAWKRADGRFGRIRLGGEGGAGMSLGGGGGVGNGWVKWPVAVVAGVVAVVLATPRVVGGVVRGLRERFGRGGGGGRGYGARGVGAGLGGGVGRGPYTSRGSFARGRREYASVGPDESDLLGEDSDEEV